MAKEQPRNSKKRMKQLPLPQQGVGARHKQSHLQQGGGGYLDVCTETKIQGLEKKPRDPRIDELKKAGVSWKWITLAETIGYDDFVVVWRMLTSLFEKPDDYMVRMVIPHAKKLERIQRNLFIQTLSESHPTKEIPKLMAELGMPISLPQVYRILERK